MDHHALAPAASSAAHSTLASSSPPVVRHDVSPPGEGGGTVVDFTEPGNPNPATLCSNLARSVVEILAGARSLDQIGRWVTDSVYVHLLRRTLLTAHARATSAEGVLRPRMRIGDPLLSFPSEGVVEAVVLVHQPARSRAVAIRLERHRARWRATAINVL